MAWKRPTRNNSTCRMRKSESIAGNAVSSSVERPILSEREPVEMPWMYVNMAVESNMEEDLNVQYNALS